MLILRKSNCISTASGNVTLEKSEWSRLLKYIVCCVVVNIRNSKIHIKSYGYNILILLFLMFIIIHQTIYFSNLDHSLVSRVTILDAVRIQIYLLRMSIIVLETCRGM